MNQRIQPFQDRREAGQVLADRLMPYAMRADVLVLGLPRGGVPVAAEVAHALRAPLDVFLVRKLGVPGSEELAMGAIASDGVRVLNEQVIRELRITPREIDEVTARETRELERRNVLYRGSRPPLDVAGKVVLVVDDGLATGSTMRAAVEALRPRVPARIVAAVPVADRRVCQSISALADEVVCAVTPDAFAAVGNWYVDFAPTTDDDVRALLADKSPYRSGSHQDELS